ncbi:MAG: divalent-cation tolerance protein CutA [Nitrospinae bacterium]|nr:divalent-cation tolerance protein CutA [Nitrospinota bacterium]
MKDGRAFRIVLSTAGSEEEGTLLAKSLVERKLCACVNMVPKIRSFYRWEGAVQDDAEVLLIIKTTQEKLQALTDLLAEIHSYDVPEVLAIEVDQGSASYLEWLAESCAD